MIRFDNGPPGGDYVRYIDELMAQRAPALGSATMTSDTDVVDRIPAADGRKNPMTAPAFKAPHERSRDAKTNARLTPKPYPSAAHSPSANASQRTSALSPAAATAIASAMMTRDNERRVVPFIGAIAIAAGTVLILIGILGRTSNVLFIVAGIALVSWAIKRLGGIVAAPAATTATDAFTAMPAQRASSRIKNKD